LESWLWIALCDAGEKSRFKTIVPTCVALRGGAGDELLLSVTIS
jgi:hypothetical protein